jgi:3-demethoxyubiquinol 3-hydroxylase
VVAHMGDAQSLGFVVETERQVEEHLAGHLDRLPILDQKSRAIVEQMRADEREHGAKAQSMGAAETPLRVQQTMQAMARIMTVTAYYV